MAATGLILLVGPGLAKPASVGRALQSADFEVVEASDVDQARQQLCLQRFELALIDGGLPQNGWLDIIHSIQLLARGLPVILIGSGMAGDELIAGLEAGADLFISRPFSDLVLIARIRALLRRTRSLANPGPALSTN